MPDTPKKIEGPIYVLGGGLLGCHYIGKIIRAKEEGLLAYPELCFIDPHADVPAVEKFGGSARQAGSARHIEDTYTEFLEKLIQKRPGNPGILIPDHSAPHVLFRVFLDLVQDDKRLQKREVRVMPFPTEQDSFPKTPFLKTLDSGICAVSYAQWTCPLECEEPSTCPAIEKERTWNFNDAFSHYTRDHHTNPLLSSHLFSCLQLVCGVAFIPIDHIIHEWDRLTHKLESQQKVELLVATFSKCHGIIGKAIVD